MTPATTSPQIDVVIPGAQRAGSTSLLRWLGSHPAVTTHRVTELPYFLGDHIHRQGWEASFRRFYDNVPPDGLLLAKSVGILYSQEATERVLDHNPATRFVVTVREPVARAVSAFHYARQLGIEPLADLDAALDRGPEAFRDPNPRRACAYIERSHYAEGIARLQKGVGEDRVLVHLFEDLVADPEACCARTFEFLGIDAVAVDTARRHNPSGAPRSRLLARAVRPADRPDGLARRALDLVPGRVRDAIKGRLLSWNRRTDGDPPPASVTPAAEARIAAACRDDVLALEALLGRDLTAWKR